MKKTIAIDCSKLNTSYRTGTHRFLVGFLNELVKNDEYNYYFYVNNDADFLSQFPFAKKGKVVCLKFPFLYTQVGLLNSLKNHDFFIFPWQTIPFLSFNSRAKKIAILHDTGFNFVTKITTFFTQVFSDQLFSVSESTAKKLIKKSIVIGEGVDENTFYTLSSSELKIKVTEFSIPKFFILSLGRIEKRKNIYNNLLAFSKIKNYYPNLKYVFIGEFIENEENIYSFMKSLDLTSEQVLFKKNISDEILNYYLNSMEFLVFTSFEEGFGLPVLESYAVEKPVLLSKIEQLAEFKISANQFVDPHDPIKISEKMLKFLNKDHGIDSKKRYKEVLSKHTWKKAVTTFTNNLK
jgi:glycosyltransferase involved in cell wall biosynthesis